MEISRESCTRGKDSESMVSEYQRLETQEARLDSASCIQLHEMRGVCEGNRQLESSSGKMLHRGNGHVARGPGEPSAENDKRQPEERSRRCKTRNRFKQGKVPTRPESRLAQEYCEAQDLATPPSFRGPEEVIR